MVDSAARSLRPESFLRREPRQARSIERVERLLLATSELLVDEGYPGVTVSGLKARTGMPHSTIYDVVADPRDLVAMLMLRELDQVHHLLQVMAADVVDAAGAVEFIRTVSVSFIERYRGNTVLRAGLSGLDGDPAYRWINLADSIRKARVVADVIVRFTAAPDDIVYERCLLMAHLTGATAAMAADLGGAEGDAIVRAFEYVIEQTVPH